MVLVAQPRGDQGVFLAVEEATGQSESSLTLLQNFIPDNLNVLVVKEEEKCKTKFCAKSLPHVLGFRK